MAGSRPSKAKPPKESPAATVEDFISDATGHASASSEALAHGEAVQPAKLDEGLERRLTRVEEWRALHDARADKLEQRVTELFDGASFFRANMLTKDVFATEKAEQRKQSWQVAGVIVGAVSLIVAVASVIVALVARPDDREAAASPAPVVIQVPAAISQTPLPKAK